MRTLILLAPDSDLPALSQQMAQTNPTLDVLSLSLLPDLLALSPQRLAQARLVAFLYEHIVPGEILRRLGFGAYNFHPGPPEYPGWQPLSFALYQQAKTFGVTLHHMESSVDSGAIVAVERFDIAPDADRTSLSIATFSAALHLFWAQAPRLCLDPTPMPALALAWSGKKWRQRDLAHFRTMPADLSDDERQRRQRAFF